MNRFITVKGTGSVRAKPDLIIITMHLESLQPEYDQTMQRATEAVDVLTDAIITAGMEKQDLKTTSFNISTHYKSYRDQDNNYKNEFDGYLCEQGLKLAFDFDSDVLSKVLSAIAKAPVDPKLDIQFSVKDKEAVSEALLFDATQNARKKAELLTKAAGVTLGTLMSIDYNWMERGLISPTRYSMEDNRMALAKASAPQIEPEEIFASDTVTFVWAIQ